MRSLIGWLAALLLGSLSWTLGDKIGLGVAEVLGAVGSGVGLWVGFRWFDQNLK